jgi:hypothetical protein
MYIPMCIELFSCVRVRPAGAILFELDVCVCKRGVCICKKRPNDHQVVIIVLLPPADINAVDFHCQASISIDAIIAVIRVANTHTRNVR